MTDAVQKEMTVEDIGQAEQVLQRLIHERKTLQGVEVVLRAYREVMAHIENTRDELRQTQEEVMRERRVLQRVKDDIAEATKKADQQAKQTAQSTELQLQRDSAALSEELKQLLKSREEVVDAVLQLQAEHKREVDKGKAEIASLHKEIAELQDVKYQLAEMLKKATTVVQ